jgi:hypothetical protein
MNNDLRRKFCYECYADWHLCICTEANGFSKIVEPTQTSMYIAGMKLTKRGELVLTIGFTLLILLVATIVGTIETMS